MSVQRVRGKFVRAPIIDGRKECVHCGEWKPVDSDFNVKTREPDGTPLTWQSYCQPCATIMNRERKGYRPRKPKLTEAQLADRRRERYRTRMRRMRKDPQRLAAWREQVRLKEKLRRERAGAKQYPPRRRQNGRRVANPWVPASAKRLDGVDLVNAAPFAAFIHREFPGTTCLDIAEAMGTTDRSIRRLLSGVEPHVTLAWVDRCLTLGMGRPDLLNTIYPLEMDQAI